MKRNEFGAVMQKVSKGQDCLNVVDIFSGAGGMSYGFHTHPSFKVIAAADRQNAKPSSGAGSSECNSTYEKNIGVRPLEIDLSLVEARELSQLWGLAPANVDVLISCAPCTGFSRTIRKSLVEDDPRNNLVRRTATFVEYFQPRAFVMENVQELLNGKFNGHLQHLMRSLDRNGYHIYSGLHSLNDFGVPQRRIRALIVAVKSPQALVGMHDLWKGYGIAFDATTVRRAIALLPPIHAGQTHGDDKHHVAPSMTGHSLERLRNIPHNGGSWPDLLKLPSGRKYLIPSMAKHADLGRVGPYRDIYGRMSWDKPAMTIKRECSSPGNGRYCHPDQDRLCSIREMAILQGFPTNYDFVAKGMSNRYRHIGDAVPPIFSYQVAHLLHWMLTGKKVDVRELLLKNAHLRESDVVAATISSEVYSPLKKRGKRTKVDTVEGDLFYASVDSNRSDV
jgi:DNA (cytosine-5)-methyltransferase 1